MPQSGCELFEASCATSSIDILKNKKEYKGYWAIKFGIQPS